MICRSSPQDPTRRVAKHAKPKPPEAKELFRKGTPTTPATTIHRRWRRWPFQIMKVVERGALVCGPAGARRKFSQKRLLKTIWRSEASFSQLRPPRPPEGDRRRRGPGGVRAKAKGGRGSSHGARARPEKADPVPPGDALLEDCQTADGPSRYRAVRVLDLDRKSVLIEMKLRPRATLDHVLGYPREIVKRALELKRLGADPRAQPPVGDPTPSRSDIDMTFQIRDAAELLGIVLHDHLIVGKAREGELSRGGIPVTGATRPRPRPGGSPPLPQSVCWGGSIY